MWFFKAQLQGHKRDQTFAPAVTQTTPTTKRERHKARVSHGTFAEPGPPESLFNRSCSQRRTDGWPKRSANSRPVCWSTEQDATKLFLNLG